MKVILTAEDRAAIQRAEARMHGWKFGNNPQPVWNDLQSVLPGCPQADPWALTAIFSALLKLADDVEVLG